MITQNAQFYGDDFKARFKYTTFDVKVLIYKKLKFKLTGNW